MLIPNSLLLLPFFNRDNTLSNTRSDGLSIAPPVQLQHDGIIPQSQYNVQSRPEPVVPSWYSAKLLQNTMKDPYEFKKLLKTILEARDKALYYAAGSEFVDAVKDLLEAGVDPNGAFLTAVSRSGGCDRVAS
jgi:hypothetical protein